MSTEQSEPARPAAPPEIPEALLDPDAVKVVRRLRRAGHEAYLVGGCVRDLLLGIRPKDFDVATSAHPNEVRAIFRNSRLIGRRFRLAHVFFGGKIIEVSTFRQNPLDELADLPQDLLIRHDNVFGTAQEDARRRDFTINGLFYDVDEGKVVDHVGGKEDLHRRLVHTIGNPDVRMREDPVRILRAIRFAAKCAFDLEPKTAAAMRAHVHEIPRCAPPRVLEEVLKLTRSGASRRCFELLREVNALRILLPPVAAYLEKGGPAEAERHLRALDALDAHVRVGEIPSDAVLLATLLAPLPRDPSLKGPIPKGPPRLPKAAPDAAAQSGAGADASVAAAAEPASNGAAEEGPGTAPPEGDQPAAGEDSDDDTLDAELSALEEESDESEENEDAAQAPLPEGALIDSAELHDERLGGIPAFSVGGDVAPWSLPQDVVAPEIVLAEMVRTARLPRRIAERARMILLAQPILSGERRRRRSSPQAFARQTYFPEALAVFELSVAATGRGNDQLARWQAIFAGQDLSQLTPDDEHGGEKSRGDGARRRRRRGGRGRGRSAAK